MPVTFTGGQALPTPGTAAYAAAQNGSGSGSYNSSTGQLSIGGSPANVSTSANSATPPGWSSSAWAQQQADLAKYFPSASTAVQNPINASTIGTNTTPYVPAAPNATNVGGMVTANNAGLTNSAFGLTLDANGRLVYNTPTAPTGTGTGAGTSTDATSTNGFMDNLRAYLGLQTKPPSVSDIYNSLPEKATYESAQQSVANLTAQLNTITAKSQADQLSVTGQGRGIPEAIIGGQQAEIAKEAAINALPVQAQLAAAQGNLQLAQDHLDTVFKLRSQDAQSQYTYQTKLIDSVFDFANKAQQQQLDNMKTQTSTNLSRVNNAINFAQTISASATPNGQVNAASALTRLIPPDPSSKNFNQELTDYNNAVAKIQGQLGGSGVTGDAPLYGGLNTATATAVRQQVAAFKTEPTITNFTTLQDGYNFAKSLDTKTTNPADDQALIYSLAKVLDPGSVVREGEYATAQKYAQSLVASYGKGVTQAINGTGFLSESARANIKATITSKYQSAEKSYDNVYNQYAGSINNLTGRDDGTKFLKDYKISSANGGGGGDSNVASTVIAPSNTTISGLTASGSWGSLLFPNADALEKFKKDHNL